MITKTTFAALAALAAMPALAVPALATEVTQTNLVSDGAVAAAFTDPNLKNPWGVSFSPTGAFWVSDNATGLSTLYTGTGSIVGLVVTIPAAAGGTGTGNPTGQVYNPGTGFVVTQGGKSGAPPFIFATEDGTISGWSPSVNGTVAVVAVDRSAMGAVYKSLAITTDSAGHAFLLAADFHNNEIDVFDSTYKLTASFRDAKLPKTYAPYNVQTLNGNVYVTYAKQDKAKHDSVSGPGLGAVEQIDLTGKVLNRFMGGKLNAPWGLAIAPASFGHLKGDVLVGNFGDGHITAFTPKLKQQSQLESAKGVKIAIDGLWALTPGNGSSAGSASNIYFTAGTNGEADGLLGSLTPHS